MMWGILSPSGSTAARSTCAAWANPFQFKPTEGSILRTATRTAIAAAITAPFIVAFAGAASATTSKHDDPCPGAHIQVWADLGGKGIDNGGAEATDHFVCAGDIQGPAGPKGDKGDVGPAGADGKDGADSTVPGPAGPVGPAGHDGLPGTPGRDGVDGKAGLNGEVGATGPQGLPGVAGADGAAGVNGKDGANGLPGAKGADGKPGVTKTVIVKADGTQQTVDGLPHTGVSDATAVMALLGLTVAGLGTCIVLTAKRK